MVGFFNAALFKHLQKAIFACGHNDFPVFGKKLATYILRNGTTTDPVCCNGSMFSSQESVSLCIHFRFGRIQRASSGTNLDLGGTSLPGTNKKPFIFLRKDLKDQLMIIFNNPLNSIMAETNVSKH